MRCRSRTARRKGSTSRPRLNFVPPPEVPTPESASIQARAIALGIDALVWLAAFVPLAVIYGGISSSNGLFRIKISGPPLLMAAVLWLAYMTWMEAKHGASIGKRARGLRVVMEDGEPVDPEAALTRNVMRFVDAFPYVVPYLLGAYAVSNSPKMQRFGDRVAETMVVVSSPASPDPGHAGPPAAPPTTRIEPTGGVLDPPQAPPAGGGGRDGARARGRLHPDAGCELGAPPDHEMCRGLGETRGLDFVWGRPFRLPPPPSKDLARRLKPVPPSGEMDHRPIVGAWPRLEDVR
jgi:uncharacterized RDD family membrane protein YckC